MVHEFDLIPISDEKKPRVGIVGEILVKFLPAANNHLAELLEAEGISGKLLDMHTIKPLDEDLVVAAAKETGKVVTVEEHSIIGGLGGAVCECLAEKAPVPVKRIGIHDVFGESGPALELLHKYGLDAEGIYKQIKEFA